MNANDAVQFLYESFPYPKPDEDLTSVLEKKRRPAWNPLDSQAIYFPQAQQREQLDVLIAGCGTNTGQQHAAYLPNMRFWAIDISEHSLSQARRITQSHGLKNIQFFQLPIEKVAELGQTFDYISCHGVLHHLENPVEGLRALSSVLRPDGAMSLMVYAQHGRTGIYQLQELFRDRMGLQVCREDLTAIQQALTVLPQAHPFRIIHNQRHQLICLEEIADMLLHPRDKPYTVQDVSRLVDDAGLQFQRFLGQAPYRPEVSPLSQDSKERMLQLPPLEQAAALELFYGTIIKHEFCVTHRNQPSHRELFSQERFLHAVPSLSGHLQVEVAGKDVVLSNQQHAIELKSQFPIRQVGALLKKVDGKTPMHQVVETAVRSKETELKATAAFEMLYGLYLSDFLDVRSVQ